MKFTLNHALYAAALLALAGSPAAAADISVFSSGAPSAVLKVLAVAFARDTGNRVEFTVGDARRPAEQARGGGDARSGGGAGAGHRKAGEGGHAESRQPGRSGAGRRRGRGARRCAEAGHFLGGRRAHDAARREVDRSYQPERQRLRRQGGGADDRADGHRRRGQAEAHDHAGDRRRRRSGGPGQGRGRHVQHQRDFAGAGRRPGRPAAGAACKTILCSRRRCMPAAVRRGRRRLSSSSRPIRPRARNGAPAGWNR